MCLCSQIYKYEFIMEKLLYSYLRHMVLINNALISSTEKCIRRDIFIFSQNFAFDIPEVT